MNEYIYSLWQDYETHLFTCERCKTQTLGDNLIHDFDASDLVMPLDCPACNWRVAMLKIQASQSEIKALATQGFKTAQEHLSSDVRWYESFPDFSQGLNAEEAAERVAYAIEFMADPELGKSAIQLMDMLAFGIRFCSSEIPYSCEANSHSPNPNYFQVIRGTEGQYYVEISSPKVLGKQEDQILTRKLEELGWLAPNVDSPNYHLEYSSKATRYLIAHHAAKTWLLYFKY